MRLERLELLTVELPLKIPFRTSFGTEYTKEALLVHAFTDVGEGWGECVASPEPLYSSEYNAASVDVIRRFLAPPLFAAADLRADDVAGILAPIKGHRMSKAALEMAILDAELRAAGESFGQRLGATVDRVPSGVSVGILDSIPQLIEHVGGYLDEGYVRIKLKIEPGWDIDAVRRRARAVRRHPAAGRRQHRVHAGRRRASREARCLRPAADRAATRRGGHPPARRARQADPDPGLPGRVRDVAGPRRRRDRLAGLPDHQHQARPGRWLPRSRPDPRPRPSPTTWRCGAAAWSRPVSAEPPTRLSPRCPASRLPGDVSGSDRFFAEDITEPIVMRDGYVDVPSRPGLGVEPLPGAARPLHDLDRDASRPDSRKARPERPRAPSSSLPHPIWLGRFASSVVRPTDARLPAPARRRAVALDHFTSLRITR